MHISKKFEVASRFGVAFAAGDKAVAKLSPNEGSSANSPILWRLRLRFLDGYVPSSN